MDTLFSWWLLSRWLAETRDLRPEISKPLCDLGGTFRRIQ